MATDTTLTGWTSASRIAGNTRASVTPTWVFALLWNVVSTPILFYVPSELERNPLAAIAFLFPVVGAGLLVWATMNTLRWRRFGQTWLELASVPVTVGGQLTGAIHARLTPPAAGQSLRVAVKLTCLRRAIKRRSDDSDVSETIVWRDEEEVAAERIAFGSEDAAIPIRFSIPADALETTAVGKGSGVLWVLTAEAQLPGVNLKEDFDVAVIQSSEARAKPPLVAASTSRTAHVVTLESLAQSGITVQPTDAGTTYHFGAMRNTSLGAGMTFFLLLWTGGLWLQWTLGFPRIFPILFGLLDLLLLWLVIDVWFGTTAVTIGSGVIRRRRSTFGVGSTREIPATEIEEIALHIAMQTSGRHGTPYYSLRATRKNGRKLSLGDGIRSKREAEWLADQMRAALGVRGIGTG